MQGYLMVMLENSLLVILNLKYKVGKRAEAAIAYTLEHMELRNL